MNKAIENSRILVIGDPHAVPDELVDMESLFNCIEGAIEESRPKALVFLGDLHHTHGVTHTSVTRFYLEWFSYLRETHGVTLILMRGNHDHSLGNPDDSALLSYANCPGVQVVDCPTQWSSLPGLGFMPYYGKQEAFLAAFEGFFSPPKTLFCHETFADCVFESGMPCKDGVDSSLVSCEKIISGHIHRPQEFKNVWYPGAPRWRTLSDANFPRAIHFMEFDHTGQLVGTKSFPTGDHCGVIYRIHAEPEMRHSYIPPREKDTLRVDMEGPADWVATWRPVWVQRGAIIGTVKLTDKRPTKVRESEGVENAFRSFSGEFKGPHGTPPSRLQEMAKERLSW